MSLIKICSNFVDTFPKPVASFVVYVMVLYCLLSVYVVISLKLACSFTLMRPCCTKNVPTWNPTHWRTWETKSGHFFYTLSPHRWSLLVIHYLSLSYLLRPAGGRHISPEEAQEKAGLILFSFHTLPSV